MGLNKNDDNKNYVSILGSDATLRITVTPETPGAVKREYETSDGTKGVKHELVFNDLTGKITGVKFYDGDFGKLVQLDVTDDTGTLTLSVNTAQNYGEDILKKLPNIDFSKEVKFAPYAFVDEQGKSKKGVTIYQDENKVQSAFYDPIAKKNILGYPDPKPTKNDKPRSKDDWKIYFLEARQFLVEYTEEKIMPKFETLEDFINADEIKM